MPDYRRVHLKGGTYFITIVTFNRKPIFHNPSARGFLHDAWLDVTTRFPFQTVAVCLLFDHLHTLIKLPESDANYPMRIREIERLFTAAYKNKFDVSKQVNNSHIRKNEVAVWQRRYWGHTIRNERDLNNHINYIHYNPVKHGLVDKVADWHWSSFHQ